MPTQEQANALQQFALEHGRNWKAALRSYWCNGGWERYTGSARVSVLQGVRNDLGPTWLSGLTPQMLVLAVGADKFDALANGLLHAPVEPAKELRLLTHVRLPQDDNDYNVRIDSVGKVVSCDCLGLWNNLQLPTGDGRLDLSLQAHVDERIRRVMQLPVASYSTQPTEQGEDRVHRRGPTPATIASSYVPRHRIQTYSGLTLAIREAMYSIELMRQRMVKYFDARHGGMLSPAYCRSQFYLARRTHRQLVAALVRMCDRV